MYHTSQGDRTLSGPEAELFREALGMAYDHVRLYAEENEEFGIPFFDNLSFNSKVAMLEQVGAALLIEKTPPPKLSAVVEATVGLVFFILQDYIQAMLIEDCETPNPNSSIHRLLHTVLVNDIDPEDMPSVDCKNEEEWDFLVECATDRILWDADWMDDAAYLDLPQQIAQPHMDAMGIDRNYFMAIAPDPTDQQMPEIVTRLQRLACYPE